MGGGVPRQIAEIIAATPEFKQDLDWSARPGTKTYPRWKDALVGCFKQGRYPHLFKHPSKVNGLNVYYLDENKMVRPCACSPIPPILLFRNRLCTSSQGPLLLAQLAPSQKGSPRLHTQTAAGCGSSDLAHSRLGLRCYVAAACT